MKTIIKAKIDDLQGILDLISNCVQNMISNGSDQWDSSYPSMEIRNDIACGFAYIVKSDDNYAAYVAINEIQSPEYGSIKWITEGKKVLVIHRLCVDPAFQGMGIAKMLLGFIKDFACKNGYASIRLDTYSINETAKKLYEKSGYIHTGQLFFNHRGLPFECYEKMMS